MARISKEEQEQIRKKIVDVSRELFLTDGYDQTSTKSIAKKVGIAEGTLFNYFTDKTELFFESIYEDYMDHEDQHKSALVISEEITDVIYSHMMKSIGIIFKMPKLILGEIAIASIKLAKKNPTRFRKYVELDFKYMLELSSYFDKLIEHHLMEKTDTKALGEIIYSVIAYELMMYIYDASVSLETMQQHIKSKISMTMKGYFKGEKKDVN